MSTLNKPYVRSSYGEITKEKPYISGISQRPFKRGSKKIVISEFVKDSNGNPKVIVKRKNRKGKWIND